MSAYQSPNFFQTLTELTTTNDFPKLLLHKLTEEEILKYLSTPEIPSENAQEHHPRPRHQLKRRRSTITSKGYSNETDHSYEADSSDETDDSDDLIRPAKRAKLKTTQYSR